MCSFDCDVAIIGTKMGPTMRVQIIVKPVMFSFAKNITGKKTSVMYQSYGLNNDRQH